MTAQSSTSVSPWVDKFARLVPTSGMVLDLACGGGRHTGLFLDRGNQVMALDRDTTGLTAYEDNTACEIVSFDLEVPNLIDANQTAIDYGPHLPFYERDLACIVVVNYLYRPLLPVLPQALRPGGLLIYQTFMRGNEAYGRPRNPEFLLASRELPETFQTDLEEIDFFEGYIESPKPAMIQGYCGRKISGV